MTTIILQVYRDYRLLGTFSNQSQTLLNQILLQIGIKTKPRVTKQNMQKKKFLLQVNSCYKLYFYQQLNRNTVYNYQLLNYRVIKLSLFLVFIRQA